MTKAELRILRALRRSPLFAGALWVCVPMFEVGALDELVAGGLVERRPIPPATAGQFVLTEAGRAELARQESEVPK